MSEKKRKYVPKRKTRASVIGKQTFISHSKVSESSSTSESSFSSSSSSEEEESTLSETSSSSSSSTSSTSSSSTSAYLAKKKRIRTRAQTSDHQGDSITIGNMTMSGIKKMPDITHHADGSSTIVFKNGALVDNVVVAKSRTGTVQHFRF